MNPVAQIAPGEFDPFAGPALAARLPLTESQREIWLATQLHAAAALAFNEGVALRLAGSLDAEALRRAIGELVQRHEVLRASISPSGDWLMVGAEASVALPCVVDDGSGTALAQAQTEEMALAFDLERGPLIRFRLIRESEQVHHLLMVWHHIAVDGWSNCLLLEELASLYTKQVGGLSEDLAPAPNFMEYVAAEKAFLEGPQGQLHIAYWLESLKGVPPAPKMPADRTQPQQRSYTGACVDFALEPELLQRFKTVSAEQGASLVAGFLALLAALFHRAAAADDLVVAVSAAGQNFHRLPGLAGHCVNLLPLRVRPNGGMSFRELLEHASDVLLSGLDHQGTTYGSLLSRMKFERDLTAAPLLAAVLNVVPTEKDLLFCELKATRHILKRQAVVFDWHFNVFEDPLCPFLRCSYNAELFSEAMVRERLADLESLLRAATADCDAKIAALPLLQAHRRAVLTQGWNATAREYPLDRPLHQFIEAAAASRPEAPAVIGEEGLLSYAELNRRADSLARRLRQSGVLPGSIVGVCSRRSLYLPVALLAVLKAGGAYLPLDPDYPQQRLSLMLEDAECPVVLAGADLDAATAAWLAQCGTPVIPIESARVDLPLAEQILGPRAGPGDPAYVIFTSGSTGRPKGAIIEHRAIVNRLLWMQECYAIGPHDRILQKTPFSFDVSVWEFFWPLMTGAAMVIAQPDGHKNPSYIADLIEREHITICHFVPSMLGLFLQQPEMPPCRALKHVFCSGEALSYPVTNSFRERLPAARLHNLYGPTEAAVDVSYWQCLPDPQRQLVPIGRPVANTQLLVLDADLQPVPVGIPGELYLGGIQLARAYLKRPELTAQRFIEHAEFGRLYRTGDLARWLPDGVVDYLGRLDGQVKLRGQRLELGEVEARLDALPEIVESACAVREFAAGDQRLIAWAVAAEGTSLDSAEILEALRRDLPQYMIPQYLVQVAALPRLTSGKIDRKALPEPADVALRPRMRKPPATPAEQAVAAIWRELLQVEVVNRDDRFFDLGGHSLLAVKAVAALKQKFGIKPPLRSVMMETVATLALEMEGKGAVAAQAALETGLRAVPAVRLQEAFYFGAPRRRLFGMLTKPASPRKTVAVLICQSYGIEYMRSHRALYLLAERLADAGFYVMRFDYFATGDSAGDSGHARIDHWLDNISDASRELRRRTGLRDLCLIGHRLGALLAAASLKRSPPGDLRLLMVDPPDDGASWLAQQERLQLESHLWRNAQRPRSTKLPKPSALDLFGHPVGEAWREQLIALSYKDVSPMGVALSADEHFDSGVTPVRMPDPGHWDSLDWITRPWNPRSAVALLAAHLEQHVS